MRAVIFVTLILVTVIALRGCGGDDAEEEVKAHQRTLQEQVQAERDARGRAERQLAQEKRLRERDGRAAVVRLDQEERRSALGRTLSIALGCFAAVLIVLVARERRLRRTLTGALRWLLEKKGAHDG